MATAETTQSTHSKPAFGIVTVHGRVEEVQRYEGTYRTRLICPAPDSFSSPQKISVRSKTRLGSRDELVTATCRLGGYQRKPYRVTDKDTGESMNVVPVDMTLDFIE